MKEWMSKNARAGAVALLLFCLVAMVALPLAPRAVQAAPAAAADLDMKGQAFYVLDVDTSAASKVLLPGQSVVIAHLNYDSSGSASTATDYVVVMFSSDTMAANLNAGRKAIVKAGGAVTFPSANVPAGADGPREIQLKAVGHSAKVQFLVGG